MQQLFGKYLYASGVRYQDCKVGTAYDIAYADPMSVHLLSTETLECISSGCQYSRVEKTIRVSAFLSRKYLDVCARNRTIAGNCSTCWKCARTLLTLDTLGCEHLYDGVFDLNAWATIRNRYIRTVLLSRNPLLREIVELAKTRGFRFSPFQKALTALPVGIMQSLLPKTFIELVGRKVFAPVIPILAPTTEQDCDRLNSTRILGTAIRETFLLA